MFLKPVLGSAILFLLVSVSASSDRQKHKHSDWKTTQAISQTNTSSTIPHDDCLAAQAKDDCHKKLKRKRPKVPEHSCVVPTGASDLRCADCNSVMPINAAKPCYPQLAKIGRAAGVVHVEVVADKQGKVVWARIVKGHPLLQAASLRAACRSTFVPFKCNGRIIKVVRHIFYTFALN